jgi:hypothetical protein
MNPQWSECTECAIARMAWFEQIRDMDALARLDVISEQQWRAEFAAWVEVQP